MNKAGELLGQNILVAQAPFFHRTRLEILDQHVRGFQQAQENRLALRLAHVQRDGAFVAVDADKVAGVAFVKGGAPVADFVALRGFDLDDLGAMIGQNHGAVGATKDPCKVHDLDACQRTSSAGQTFTIHRCAISLRSALYP